LANRQRQTDINHDSQFLHATVICVARNWNWEGEAKARKAENRGRRPRVGLGFFGEGSEPPFHQLGVYVALEAPLAGSGAEPRAQTHFWPWKASTNSRSGY